MGNAGDNRVRKYRLRASKTQQLADVTPICYLCGVARGSRQPMTDRLARYPSNKTVKIKMQLNFEHRLLMQCHKPIEYCKVSILAVTGELLHLVQRGWPPRCIKYEYSSPPNKKQNVMLSIIIASQIGILMRCCRCYLTYLFIYLLINPFLRVDRLI